MKILHFGEAFIDAPYSLVRSQDSALRRHETRDTFTKVIKYIVREEVDICLITGNLVNAFYVTLDTVDFLKKCFQMAPKCKFFITPGKEDSLRPASIYLTGDFPSNVYVFQKTELETVYVESLRTSVTGWAYVNGEFNQAPLSLKSPSFQGDFHLVMGYASEYQEQGVSSISVNQIGDFGGDYVALSGGKIFAGFQKVNRTIFAYSGALEHSSFKEPGFGGANLIVMERKPATGELMVTSERVAFGARRYVMEELDLTGISSANDVLSKITNVIKAKGYGQETALCVRLTGKTPVGFALPKTLTNENFGLYLFDLQDDTVIDFDDSRVARDMTIRGEFCRTLLPSMKEGTEPEKQAAAYAIRMGLGALDGRDVSKL